MVGHQLYDQVAVGLTSIWVIIKWLQLGWVAVCGEVNHLSPRCISYHQGQLRSLLADHT